MIKSTQIFLGKILRTTYAYNRLVHLLSSAHIFLTMIIITIIKKKSIFLIKKINSLLKWSNLCVIIIKVRGFGMKKVEKVTSFEIDKARENVQPLSTMSFAMPKKTLLKAYIFQDFQ